MVVLPTTTPVAAHEPETPARARNGEAAAFRQVLARTAPDAATLVAPVRTAISSGQASEALRHAWTDAFGEEPSPRTVGILTAQWAHETGSGASMYNYNFAGIKGASPAGFSVAQRTREGWGDNERRIVDRFRAYGTAEEGAADYVKLLASRFPEAVGAAKNGSAEGFVHALKSRGYFTGDEAAYTRSVVAYAGADPVDPDAPALAAPRLDYTKTEDRAFYGAPALGGASTAPFVDALAMAEELSRTALGIAAAPDRDRRGAT